MARLWVHETERVFRDRMVNEADMQKFDEFRFAVTKKYFDDCGGIAAIEERPLLYTSFMVSTPEDVPVYCVVPSYDVSGRPLMSGLGALVPPWCCCAGRPGARCARGERPVRCACSAAPPLVLPAQALKRVLEDKLREYNESNAVMDLVLFQQAMEHVTRIARIIDLPRGNAMLVGVGGSGKQSLARLASFICGYEVFQISVSSTYGVTEFKENLLSLYRKAGTKGTPVTFLMTDNQIVKEAFLVYINDLLSTGYIADLFTAEDKEAFSNAVRNECKAAGILDTMENLWDFFINKVRKYLHVVLCFSPVGDKFRIRARQFPALVNCTMFDWFHGWPSEALVSVAQRFLADVPNIEDTVRENMAYHMAYAHQCVTEASVRFQEAYRRYNYTTPKSYLELISLYKQLLLVS